MRRREFGKFVARTGYGTGRKSFEKGPQRARIEVANHDLHGADAGCLHGQRCDPEPHERHGIQRPAGNFSANSYVLQPASRNTRLDDAAFERLWVADSLTWSEVELISRVAAAVLSTPS